MNKEEVLGTDLIQISGVNLTKHKSYNDSEFILARLLDLNSAKDSYVMLRHILNTIELCLEKLKEGAINNLRGSEEEVLGAVLKVSYRKTYSFNSPILTSLEKQKKEIDEAIKTHKKLLQLSGLAGWVDTATGNIEDATLESEKAIISSTFKEG